MKELELMEAIGMKKALKITKEKMDRNARLHTAYNEFPFVSQEAIDKFNAKLKDETSVLKDGNGKIIYRVDPMKYQSVVYDKLVSYKLKDYGKIPPVDAMEKIADAQKVGCFDYFEVAEIESVVEVIDPIVFGRIKDCTDRFFIAQWDDDVKWSDLVDMNGGL